MVKSVAIALSVLSWVVASADVKRDAEGIEAISKPSEDVTLSCVRPGLVAKVLVKEGEQVKAGQVLIQLDDAAEQVQLNQLKAQADDTTRVKAAQAQLEQKKLDLKKYEQAASRGAATELEVEHARLDTVIAELSLELAAFENKQDKLKYEEARLQLERMRIVSPFDGRVEKLFLHQGESADLQSKAIRVVKTDSLWLDVPVPLHLARTLRLGQAARVRFPEAKDPAEGKVVNMAAVADAASETLTVRVEVPNPASRPAGEHVQVEFSASDEPADSTKLSPATRPATP